MPYLLFVALAGSLVIHGVALFGTDLELFGSSPAPPPLQVEIQSPPAAPVAPPAVAPVPPAKPAKAVRPQRIARAPVLTTPVATETVAEAAPEIAADSPSTVAIAPPAPPPAQPVLPARGMIRYAIIKESLGLQIGRAEHRWEFFADGRYRLTGLSETSGLAALLKPLHLVQESEGRLVAGGLQPERFRTLKNGQDANENADFDWSTAVVHLSRDGSQQAVAAGTQDLLSLNYQLAFLGKLAEGANIGVVTGKKYERYALDSLGEEEIDTPAGHFRTLHLRATTESVTEIWIALDRQRLPVKIRFTDKKGDRFEQVATELGMP